MSLGFTLFFPKKNGVLAARLGARNFTRALGYAKHPLSVVHAFADARLCRRTLFHTGEIANSLAVVASKNVNMGTNYW